MWRCLFNGSNPFHTITCVAHLQEHIDLVERLPSTFSPIQSLMQDYIMGYWSIATWRYSMNICHIWAHTVKIHLSHLSMTAILIAQ